MVEAGHHEFVVEVDGQRFRVRPAQAEGEPYAYHYDWLTGPNPDYGFSCFRGLAESTYDDHVGSIRDFLAGIDPGTGYLCD